MIQLRIIFHNNLKSRQVAKISFNKTLKMQLENQLFSNKNHKIQIFHQHQDLVYFKDQNKDNF